MHIAVLCVSLIIFFSLYSQRATRYITCWLYRCCDITSKVISSLRYHHQRSYRNRKPRGRKKNICRATATLNRRPISLLPPDFFLRANAAQVISSRYSYIVDDMTYRSTISRYRRAEKVILPKKSYRCKDSHMRYIRAVKASLAFSPPQQSL